MKYVIAVFIGSCSYGVLSTIVKLAYEEGFSPAVVTVGQFGIGWFLLWVLLPFTHLHRLRWKDRLLLMLAGVPTGLVGIFYYRSLLTVDASLAIILLFQFVWIGVVIDCAARKIMPERNTVTALILLAVGTVLGTGIGMSEVSVSWNVSGIIFGLLAALSFALFIRANAKVLPSLPFLQRSYHMVTGSLVIVTFIFLPSLLDTHPISFVDFGTKGVLLGIFGVFLPPLLFSYGMPRIGSALGSIIGSAELPVAVLLSAFVLQETVLWVQWLGVVVILFAILLPNLRTSYNKTP
ncbi:DMT family transporter [Pontibacillus salicampi]|uniref:DMT family transporter n=1 Tax=Pontibacillus salicampi TaxID=1449801 RepID=A0ABV6LPY6_9BACI